MNNNINEKEEIYEIKHHLRDIKPEDIFEDEQEPPKEYIDTTEKQSALAFDMTKKALNELKEEEKKSQNIINKKKKIEIELLKLGGALTKNQTEEKKSQKTFGFSRILKKLIFRKKKPENNSLLDEVNLNKIINYAKTTGKITVLETQDLLEINKKEAKDYLKILENSNELTKFARGK
ncbi:MAG: hypothetical protein ACTSXL_04440, partial [Alphaproteobacteria bacterium]